MMRSMSICPPFARETDLGKVLQIEEKESLKPDRIFSIQYKI